MNDPGISAKSQQGMASIIFIVLVSLALTTTSIGLIHSYKSSQQITIASNAVTHAQNGMWLGAEAFRQHLADLTTAEVLALQTKHTISLDDGNSTRTVNVENLSVLQNAPTGTVHVTADIIHKHTASKTSSAMKLVYDYQPLIDPPPSINLDPFQISFDGDLDLSGGITLVDDGNPVTLKVDGDVTLGGVSVSPLHAIYTTGSVNMASGVKATTVYANDDVHLEGSASADTVSTLGTFTIDGGGYATNVFANGDVFYNASGRSENINSRANINITSGDHGISTAGGEIDTSGSGDHDSLNAVGNIYMESWGDVPSAISEADIKCVSTNWPGKKGSPTSLSANGELINCPSSSSIVTAESNAFPLNDVDVMDELEPFVHNSAVIDVWTRKDFANYFVEYDDTENKIKVTVKWINGIEDDSVYYLGDYSSYEGNAYKDYLCTTLAPSGQCTAPAEPLFPICTGFSTSNGCITYNTSTNTFTLNPGDTAPGMMFFNGNLVLDSGHSMTSIFASGNITTAGSYKLWAPNHGAYNKICEGDGDHSRAPTRYEAEFSQYYPINFCDTVAGTYVPSQIGNVGLAAGGYPPESPGTFVGGIITLGASTEIVGAVLAGDIILTSGNVSINGPISAGTDGSSTGQSSLSGSTTIDFNSSSPLYTPTDLPDLSVHQPPATPQSATVMWVKNL